MRTLLRLTICGSLVLSFFINVIPCGPSFITPVFDIRNSPEFPYEDFAAGRLGIIKPEFHRSVLFAAFRYLNGGGFTPGEQKALTDVWRAEFRKQPFGDEDVTAAVKQWVEKRKEVVGKDEKLPQIYVERGYGGYEFFPNCTKNAFETAAETLADRASTHGAEDRNVREWLNGQDAVFSNCASGKINPGEPIGSMPQWLQKDRAYQLAAASFYSMDYEDAKRRFREIALDFESPWRETADYLVARTLIRQASVGSAAEKTAQLYEEAERQLKNFSSSTGKFDDSVERMLGLIKYRTRPQERVRELAQKLSTYGGPNFRQDVIDYVWLLDKFERLTLEEAEKQKLAELIRTFPKNTELTPEQQSTVRRLNELNGENTDSFSPDIPKPRTPDELAFRIYSEDYSKNWTVYVPIDASDDDAITLAEKEIGSALNDEMRERVRSARQSAYASRFTPTSTGNYEGGYYGEEATSIEILPPFLRDDELTNWLFTYQIKGPAAYLHALELYKQTGSPVWLIAAISKADRQSPELPRVLEAAERVPRASAAYPTLAFHTARLLVEAGKKAEAEKVIDDVLTLSADLPVSTVNQFTEMRQQFAPTLEDYLRNAGRRAFIFDFGGTLGTIDEIVAEQKTYFNPEYNKEGREAYEREVEENFRAEREWSGRAMFDNRTVNQINQFFPQSLIFEALRSPALPDYLRDRFVVAAWTRSALLGDHAAAARIAPELAKFHPELAEPLRFIQIAPTPAARQNATLYMLIKNPMLTPFIEDGLGKTDNTADVWDINDWWCEPYDEIYDEATGQSLDRNSLKRPAFLTAAQFDAATRERAKLKEIGDAPKYLARQVLEWARRSPNDKRVPEALYLMHKANGWSKWGCGSDMDIQKEIGELMLRRYPSNPFTRQLAADAVENQ